MESRSALVERIIIGTLLGVLKRTFRIYALSLAGGALLLGGASVAATAMTLPESLPHVTKCRNLD
jgi:hypothetical protein